MMGVDIFNISPKGGYGHCIEVMFVVRRNYTRGKGERKKGKIMMTDMNIRYRTSN